MRPFIRLRRVIVRLLWRIAHRRDVYVSPQWRRNH